MKEKALSSPDNLAGHARLAREAIQWLFLPPAM
jgi:hypothetical protein